MYLGQPTEVKSQGKITKRLSLPWLLSQTLCFGLDNLFDINGIQNALLENCYFK